MMQSEILVPLSDWERQLFTKLVPEDHFLRQLEPLIDFERFRPALDPVDCWPGVFVWAPWIFALRPSPCLRG